MKLSYIYKATILSIVTVALLVVGLLATSPALAAPGSRLAFPIIGPHRFSNDYDAPRSSGPHHAIDIIADKGRRLIAVVGGTLVHVAFPQPSWGYSVTIRSDAGYEYRYIHMNDDTPGTNDGRGGGLHAYAVGVKEGDRVAKGQLLGWVGDSGRSNGIPHLHFERFDPDGEVLNPYWQLVNADHYSTTTVRPRQPDEVLPNGQDKTYINVDVGNLEGDDEQETIAANHSGDEPRVRVYNSDEILMHSFLADDAEYTGGIDVAAGDVDGDGVDEIITSKSWRGDPTIKIFEPDGTLIDSFNAYDLTYQNGVRVGAADIDNDGNDEIVTGPVEGMVSTVRIFEADGTMLHEWPAFTDPSFLGGVDVAGGDVTGDDIDEIVVGRESGGVGHFVVFTPDGTQLLSHRAYPSIYMAGIRVSVGNVRQWTSKEEIVTVPRGGPYIPAAKIHDGDGNLLDTEYFWERWRNGYFDIGAGDGISKGSTGVTRRSSVRDAVD